MAHARSSDGSEWLVFTQAELGFLSRAILTRRVECPWDDTALAERLDERVKRALGEWSDLGNGPGDSAAGRCAPASVLMSSEKPLHVVERHCLAAAAAVPRRLSTGFPQPVTVGRRPDP